MLATIALTAAQWQGWVAVVGGLATAIVGLLKYFDFRSRRERAAAAGQAFLATVDALASQDEARRLAGAILLRRFFDPETEQGERTTPYANEAVRVIAALLRGTGAGTLQKLLADGLAFAPSLVNADLQGCMLERAYLGKRPDRRPDLTRADFFEADLTEASLKEAIACEAVFYRATLRGTVFRGTVLTRADFRDADLEGARFDGATLDGARFAGARNIPDEVRAQLGADGQVPAR
jgi:Pentapeptide repeats (9 copies)